MARKAKWLKGKTPYEVHQRDQAAIAKLEERIAELTQARETTAAQQAHVVRELQLQAETYRRQIETFQRVENDLNRQLTRAQTPPSVIREVTRTLVYRGSPAWVAQTLEKSLAPGVTVMGDKLGSIEVREGTDTTARVQGWDRHLRELDLARAGSK